ncbi:hypothetical protein PHSY_004698 [Pseudozyma hubeiensis SY62]|uniref:Uncharacterized protein n=1 Tax=Pseudozyma hubeiensis (strain SY62) TaxID=1305764 RepID=R9P6Z3_PSEHS|nr:hypothetical protein PHSY_004698 [Pseudozyma hubeiensis SY62]GAC97114.1 hypothetical protein PHSY_004698 [Pseudozyma hubeiensis SY62]
MSQYRCMDPNGRMLLPSASLVLTCSGSCLADDGSNSDRTIPPSNQFKHEHTWSAISHTRIDRPFDSPYSSSHRLCSSQNYADTPFASYIASPDRLTCDKRNIDLTNRLGVASFPTQGHVEMRPNLFSSCIRVASSLPLFVGCQALSSRCESAIGLNGVCSSNETVPNEDAEHPSCAVHSDHESITLLGRRCDPASGLQKGVAFAAASLAAAASKWDEKGARAIQATLRRHAKLLLLTCNFRLHSYYPLHTIMQHDTGAWYPPTEQIIVRARSPVETPSAPRQSASLESACKLQSDRQSSSGPDQRKSA